MKDVMVLHKMMTVIKVHEGQGCRESNILYIMHLMEVLQVLR